MNVKLLGVVQDYSFETGETKNMLKLELPNGQELLAQVSEDGALSATRAFLGTAAPVKQASKRSGGEDLFAVSDTDVAQRSPLRLSDEPSQNESIPAYEEDEEFHADSGYTQNGAYNGSGEQDPGEMGESYDTDEDGVGAL